MIHAPTGESKPLKLQLTNFGRRQPACRALVESPVRHRRARRGHGVVRAGRLRPLLRSAAGSAPHRPGRHRRPIRPPASQRLSVSPGTGDTALGALRGGQKLLTRPPHPTTTTTPAVKKAHNGKLAAISMARKIARRCYHTLRSPRSRTGLRHTPRAPPPARSRRRRRDRPLHTSGSRGRKLPVPACVPVFVLVRLETSSRPCSQPHRGGATQSGLLSPTMASSSTEVTLGAPRPSICRYITGHSTRFTASLVSTRPSDLQGPLRNPLAHR